MERKKTGFGIASFVLGLFGFLFSCLGAGILFGILAFVFGGIAICSWNHKKGLAIAGTVLGILAILISAVVKVSDINLGSTDSAGETNITKEENSNTDKETDSKKETETEQQDTQTAEEFKASCQELDYKTIARNPDDYVGQNFKVTVQIYSVASAEWYDSYNCYYKAYTDDGSKWYIDNLIYLKDYQDTDSDDYLKILEDDIVTVYGTFNGMVETTNYLSGEDGEEVCLDIYYADLISD